MIRYNIDSNNTIKPEGEVDPALFEKDFKEAVLDGVILKQENFVKWCQMIFSENLASRSENKIFNKEFGTWFVHKIGQKGVRISTVLAEEFEKEFTSKKLKSQKAFLALLDFLKLDWNNVERQFIEDRFIRQCIDEKKKKVQKIVRKAKRIKNKQDKI
jgi:Ran GTPase-activating protein (RanGAP) involved in mRNA processing and transport